MTLTRILIAGLIVAWPSAVLAKEIKVTPGAGALAAGLKKAKPGDVVKVAAGEFSECVTVNEGVTIEGAGANKTTIVANEYAAINCSGPRVRIVGLTIRADKKCVRGVNTSTPVRIERCRFEDVPEGVALMKAPLSDVIACEFIKCGIGVRAIGGACPTVWGCVFDRGNIGFFGMNGAPYIRNNLFKGVKTGIRMAPGDADGGIVRNNLFFKCETAAIELGESKESFSTPSIRNFIVVECGAALRCPKAMVASTSHAVLTGVKAPAFRDAEDNETLEIGDKSLKEVAVKVTIDKTNTVKVETDDSLKKGIRLWSEKEGTAGTIGLESEWARVGTGATAELPPVRWIGKILIANSVSEEYVYVRMLGRKSAGQGLRHEDGTPVDRLKFDDGKEPDEIAFDLSRFFAEAFLK